MPQSSSIFANAFDQAFAGNINWVSHTIKMGLMIPSWTPDLVADVHWSDVSANEITGTGYTPGGATLATKTHVVTAANSWATTWVATTAHALGDIIRPTTGNGFIYVCVAAGTTGSSAPTFPVIVGEQVADGTVIWSCLGQSLTTCGSDAVSWPTSTFTTGYGVLYDAQTGVASTEPLIALLNFGGSEGPASTTFQINCPPTGWFWHSPA